MEPTTCATISNSIDPIPAPLNYPIWIPTPNPNPVHAQPALEPFTYYPQIPQQQNQPQYCHLQQPQPHMIPGDVVHASYYHDPNLNYYQANALISLAHQPGTTVPSGWLEQPVAAIPSATPLFPSQTAVQSYGVGIEPEKRVSKKRKITQSAYCDICKVECNSKDILEKHKAGKRHLKNISKMVLSQPSITATSNSAIRPAQNLGKNKDAAVQKSKSAAPSQQDIGTKWLKVVAGGAAATAVRVCTTCNVVCNSEAVFNFHISGKKHAASMKKYLASTTGNTTVT